MIALGGTIGTGLFIGTGVSLAQAGPAGILIAYVLVAPIAYSVAQSVGEMSTHIPIPGSYSQFITRFVDPSLGFATNTMYWFSWAIT